MVFSVSPAAVWSPVMSAPGLAGPVVANENRLVHALGKRHTEIAGKGRFQAGDARRVLDS